ncbi:VOC family protein [Spongiimicrobium salis]|uniref:VOC family protein n=1 Tax=Spongiimicrobium salis TaxID=1667022 RepID=UPI00374DD43C
MELTHLQLGIQNPEKTLPFYLEILGMEQVHTFKEESRVHHVLQFRKTGLKLELVHDKKWEQLEVYQEKRTDNYWKFSLFVADIEGVGGEIRNKNHSIGDAYQFGDIGYLSHTKDPENHQIEFIQKTFKSKGTIPIADTDFPLKECPNFGLITLRSTDPLKSIQFYETIFDMQVYVRMYVDRGNGFTLYFLGKKGLTPPSWDMDAIENREWMYQQKETFIELQYYWGSEYDANFKLEKNNPLGYRGMVFCTTAKEKLKLKLEQYRVPITTIYKGKLQLTSPDGHQIQIV